MELDFEKQTLELQAALEKYEAAEAELATFRSEYAQMILIMDDLGKAVSNTKDFLAHIGKLYRLGAVGTKYLMRIVARNSVKWDTEKLLEINPELEKVPGLIIIEKSVNKDKLAQLLSSGYVQYKDIMDAEIKDTSYAAYVEPRKEPKDGK